MINKYPVGNQWVALAKTNCKFDLDKVQSQLAIAFINFDGADYEEPNDANSDGVYELQVRAVEDTPEALETILDLLITSLIAFS